MDFWGGELFCPQDGVENALIIAVLFDISSSSETIKIKCFSMHITVGLAELSCTELNG